MKRFAVAAIMALGLATGCAADKSQELFETAQFEEKQNNTDHARKLYQEIADKYPDSAVAKQAQARLAALGGK